MKESREKSDVSITIGDEISEEDLKKSREERKANGRMVALIVAVSLIFVAIYHAWIRKTHVLGGALISALIMILYGGWVVFLAKRDKRRRLLMEQRMSEKLSEKGSEFGTQENLIVQPTKANLNGLKKPDLAILSTPQPMTTVAAATTEPKRKRRHKRREAVRGGVDMSVTVHGLNARAQHRGLIFGPNAPTEAISKLRQDRVPLCRTCSVP